MDSSYCLKCKRNKKILIRKDLLQKIKIFSQIFMQYL